MMRVPAYSAISRNMMADERCKEQTGRAETHAAYRIVEAADRFRLLDMGKIHVKVR